MCCWCCILDFYWETFYGKFLPESGETNLGKTRGPSASPRSDPKKLAVGSTFEAQKAKSDTKARVAPAECVV